MLNNAFRLISWNVKGLGSTIKRGRVMSHLKQLKGDVYFLQETHMLNKEVARLKVGWVGDVFHSTFNCKARGTAILIRKGVPFSVDKSVLDPSGRFVMVSGRLHDIAILFVCVYGPNWDDNAFITKLFTFFPDLEGHYIIMGGDFNLVQDTGLDRSSNKAALTSKSAKTLSTLSDQFGLTDPWRHKFPVTKKYSFFSSVHHTYSRIDFFLLDIRLLSNIVTTEYHSIAISDHAPISLDLNMFTCPQPFRSWRFNSALLAEDGYKQFVQSQIALFFELNDLPDTSRGILWEASKACIRGHLISYISNVKKTENLQTDRLLQDIKKVDERYAIKQDPTLYKERLRLQTEFDLISTTKVRTSLLKARQRFFESGDKAGKLLTHQGRVEATSRLIRAVKLNTSNISTDPQIINDTFSEYYTSLYMSDNPCPPNDILDNIVFPQVSEDEAKMLGAPITTAEVLNAVKSLQSGKSPGPDGFTAEYYKCFANLLVPYLTDMYNEARTSGHLPRTLSEASISLLLKKDKDPLLCGSYRPISLLNVDFKILSKVLALRLQTVLTSIVNSDQTGFMTGQQSFYNTRRLLNIITLPSDLSPEVVVSLDAEKAFDRVEWCFLYEVLARFGLGEAFVNWVKILYSSPKASVRTNNISSPPFSLRRGTRQGCPLSPLLFTLVIEPLAIWLRSEVGFQGITRLSTVHKVSLYADDLLLYISDPVNSFPIILNILNEYGSVSGYKINYSKSIIFPINELAKQLPHSIVPFTWSSSGLQYLGIHITTSLPDLFRHNIIPLVEKMEGDFTRWSALPLSLVGRINLVKMVVLPKFLYFFQHLPIFLTKSFFDNLDKKISTFLWNGGPTRIRKSVLQSPVDKGGFALPVFRYYYWAANIQKLLFWMNLKGNSLPAWVQLENKSSRFSLCSVICAQLPLPVSGVTNSPIVATSLKIWSQVRKVLGLPGPSILTSIYKNCTFEPSTTDSAFQVWHNKGLKSIKDLFIDNTFSSFTHLLTTYDLPRHHLFRFFQVRDYVKKLFPYFPNRPPETLIDTLLNTDPTAKRSISLLYSSIMSVSSTSFAATQSIWEENLNIKLTNQQWDTILSLVHKSSICARHRLIQCKVVFRAHYTNARLAKIYPSVSNSCSRCDSSPADHVHMFWACVKLKPFWQAIFDTLSKAYDYSITPNSLSGIFGVAPSLDAPKKLKQALAFSTLLARRLILLNWKLPNSPSHSRWVREVLNNLKLEKLRLSLKGSVSSFHNTWDPFINFVLSYNFSFDLED